MVKFILEKLERKKELIEFVEDRKAHDFIYAINFNKIKEELDWQPRVDFNTGIEKTIEWYKELLKKQSDINNM